MEALVQLSEVQRAFVQFCSVLQELILNHQVAHSVVQSLHNDLPALQPERRESNRAAPTAAGGSGSSGARGLSTALEQLQLLAPRWATTAAAADATPDPSYRVTSECQDNYIVLQNAAFKSQDLLGRLGQLQRKALAALAAGQEEGCGADPVAPHEVDSATAGTVEGVDVVLFTDPGTASDSGGGGGGVDGAAATTDAGTAATPGPLHSASVDASNGAVVATERARAASQPLSAPELSILMAELKREAALEVELLGRVASAVDLNTSADDLYVYDMMLKLQPYTNERVLAAALAHRDQLVPRRSSRDGNRGGGDGGGGGQPRR